jgi:hypothetical protein
MTTRISPANSAVGNSSSFGSEFLIVYGAHLRSARDQDHSTYRVAGTMALLECSRLKAAMKRPIIGFAGARLTEFQAPRGIAPSTSGQMT